MRLILPLLLAISLGRAGAAPQLEGDSSGVSQPAPSSRSSHVPVETGGTIFCTPNSISVPGEEYAYVKNPIAAALRAAEPGSRIQLAGGDYPPFSIGMGTRSDANADTRGGRRGSPVVIEGGPGVRIVGGFDTIAINYALPVGYITFRELTIVPGSRSGVIFYKNAKAVYRGFSFEDCHILGDYDHLTGRGKPSKWGVKANNLADFKFIGKRGPARVENIAVEHGFYLQNHLGPILIERVHAKALGRTFVQFTARPGEGPPGKGNITVRNCVVEDVCIGRGDGYKGGSAFTLAGRLKCKVLIEGNLYRQGFDSAYHKLTRKGQPYGTGALAAWTERSGVRNGKLVLRDNRFSMAEGCGDRALLTIGGCEEVNIVGENVFRSGGNYEALALDPVYLNGKKVSPANGSVFVSRSTQLEGELTIEGKPASERQLSALRSK